MTATLVRAPRRCCSARTARGDRRGVAQAPEQHDGTGCRGRRGDRGAVDRDGVRGVVEREPLAARDGIRHRRREPQHVDDHDDVGGREAGEAVDAPLEAHLVAGLIERLRLPGIPSSLRPPARHRLRAATVRDWGMRILLKLVIDCDADAAWRALHSPRAVAELYGPLHRPRAARSERSADGVGAGRRRRRCSCPSAGSCRWAAS